MVCFSVEVVKYNLLNEDMVVFGIVLLEKKNIMINKKIIKRKWKIIIIPKNT